MKVKLLKKVRAKYKIIRKGRYGNAVLLDLKNKIPLSPFVDWTLSAYTAYKRYAIRQTLGDKRYEEMKIKHEAREFRNRQRARFEEELAKCLGTPT